MCIGKVCEFQPLKGKTCNISVVESNMGLKNNEQLSEDLLALSTRYTKIFLCTLNRVYNSIFSSKYFRIISRSTQPAHIITVCAALALAFVLFPKEKKSPSHLTSSSPLWTLIYLGSFSIHLGVQIWMTFISGLALYFNLPRHLFGIVQKILFPKYFLLNALLSFISLSTFFHCHNINLQKINDIVQGSSLLVCFLSEFLIYIYLAPPLLNLMEIKNKMEREAGIGMEIGHQDLKTLATDANYLKIHKSFRTTHMVIAIGNIASIGCSALQLFYLANKLCVL